MLRINKSGTIPTDNPFYARASGNNRAIWALGLRNPFKFAVQPGTGTNYSPSGKKIAYSGWDGKCCRVGDWENYTINVGGGKPVQLTNNSTDDTSPSWEVGSESSLHPPVLQAGSVDAPVLRLQNVLGSML
jgi:hypothetical protein